MIELAALVIIIAFGIPLVIEIIAIIASLISEIFDR
jgi:hypothetical protein